jgi:hypothetical protein
VVVLASVSAASGQDHVKETYYCNALARYIDPGTGSIIIQILIGVLAGVLVALKIFWIKIRNFFKKNLCRDPEHERAEH